MTTINMMRSDTIDLRPDEFIKMKQESLEKIESVQFMLPPLGSSEGFGKIRVKLVSPKYEVGL
jgi:hypothetical protein